MGPRVLNAIALLAAFSVGFAADKAPASAASSEGCGVAVRIFGNLVAYDRFGARRSISVRLTEPAPRLGLPARALVTASITRATRIIAVVVGNSRHPSFRRGNPAVELVRKCRVLGAAKLIALQASLVAN
jgi:hypothetical protein